MSDWIDTLELVLGWALITGGSLVVVVAVLESERGLRTERKR